MKFTIILTIITPTWIALKDMIADIMTMINKKLPVIIKELFIRCRNLNISLAFITQPHFSVLKEVRLNCILNNEDS